MTTGRLFDGLLALMLIWLAWRAVSDEDLPRAVIKFIVLGLMMALTWLRLGAPDVALAEAAVGSGLTGVLFLVALRRRQAAVRGAAAGPEEDGDTGGDTAQNTNTAQHAAAAPPRQGSEAFARFATWLAPAVLFALAARAMIRLPERSEGLLHETLGSLDKTGVENPVTAVLLNYRGYDTLLELAVLLVSIVAVWSLRRVSASSFAKPSGPILSALLRLLLPLLLLTGCYLLWIGAFAPGGAFQGGALLGGAFVLMLLGGLFAGSRVRSCGMLRTGLWIGLSVFIAVGLGAMLMGGNLLEYPVQFAGTLILSIEAAALISIGLTLGVLFYGGRPAPAPDPMEKLSEEP